MQPEPAIPAPALSRLAYVLGPELGGIAQHVRDLVEAVGQRAAAVAVCAPNEVLEHYDYASAGAQAYPVEIHSGPDSRDLRSVTQLRSALADFTPDVVHVQGIWAGLVTAWASPAKVALVMTWHDQPQGETAAARAARLGARVLARRAQASIGTCAELVEWASSLGAANVRLVELAAPPVRARPGAAGRVRRELDALARPLVLSQGWLEPRRGHDTLVAAAAKWRTDQEPAALAAIVGTGPQYRQLAADILQLRAPVTLLGHRDDLGDLLAAADVAVLTDSWAGRPFFAAQALAAGVPLVATAAGGVAALVGDAALLVPNADADALASAVTQLLASTAIRNSLIAAGRRRAAHWPDRAASVEAILACYRAAVAAAL